MWLSNSRYEFLSEMIQSDYRCLNQKCDQTKEVLDILLKELGYEYKEENFKGLVKVKKTKA